MESSTGAVVSFVNMRNENNRPHKKCLSRSRKASDANTRAIPGKCE